MSAIDIFDGISAAEQKECDKSENERLFDIRHRHLFPLGSHISLMRGIDTVILCSIVVVIYKWLAI